MEYKIGTTMSIQIPAISLEPAHQNFRCGSSCPSSNPQTYNII